MNNYIVRSYRDVIVVTNIEHGEPVKHKVKSCTKIQKTLLNNIIKIKRLTMGQFSKVL